MGVIDSKSETNVEWSGKSQADLFNPCIY